MNRWVFWVLFILLLSAQAHQILINGVQHEINVEVIRAMDEQWEISRLLRERIEALEGAPPEARARWN